jgi:F-type H+-transporting ATPase subunit epsilon
VARTRFDLVTPTETLYSGEAEMVVCRTTEGEIAFLADHMPYIGALDPCLVRVVGPDEGEFEVRFAARGGFVEVKGSQVIMLADLALTPAEVDVQEAERDAASAAQQASTGDEGEREQGEADLRWVQARLEAAQGS